MISEWWRHTATLQAGAAGSPFVSAWPTSIASILTTHGHGVEQRWVQVLQESTKPTNSQMAPSELGQRRTGLRRWLCYGTSGEQCWVVLGTVEWCLVVLSSAHHCSVVVGSAVMVDSAGWCLLVLIPLLAPKGCVGA